MDLKKRIKNLLNEQGGLEPADVYSHTHQELERKDCVCYTDTGHPVAGNVRWQVASNNFPGIGPIGHNLQPHHAPSNNVTIDGQKPQVGDIVEWYSARNTCTGDYVLNGGVQPLYSLGPQYPQLIRVSASPFGPECTGHVYYLPGGSPTLGYGSDPGTVIDYKSWHGGIPKEPQNPTLGAKIKPTEPIEVERDIEIDFQDKEETMKTKIKEELENFDDTIGQVEFQDELVKLSSSERAQLKDMLEDALDDKQTLEEAFDYKGIPELKAKGVFGKMFKWLKRYLTDKAATYLINASAEETKDTIDLIQVMDPNDMTGIFEPRAIYLGGAIDFATDALGWRTAMERYFGESHVVKDERMAKLVLTGEWDTKGISEPAILNPMRAETVREEDAEFTDLFGKWKKDSLTDDEMKAFREKIRQNIILQDLRMLDICDTNLLRYDGKAGAGTLGEAQISALKNQQIFLWVTDGMKISNVSPWLLPAVTKICIDDEIWELLKHFK